MLTELRLAIANELKAGGFERAYEYVADTITPPCAVVVPGQPYVEQRPGTQGFTFGELSVTVDVLLVAARDINKKNAAKVDDLVELGLAALKDREVVRVSRPDIATLSGIKYLGSVLTINETTEAP